MQDKTLVNVRLNVTNCTIDPRFTRSFPVKFDMQRIWIIGLIWNYFVHREMNLKPNHTLFFYSSTSFCSLFSFHLVSDSDLYLHEQNNFSQCL